MTNSVDTGALTRLEQQLTRRERTTLEATRRAAVAVVLQANGPEETMVLLIERTTRSDDPWSGQMAFPGGRVDPEDDGPLSAACREVKEEVGIDLLRVARHVGAGDDLRAMARGKRLDLVVTPFIFVLEVDPGELEMSLQADEVAGVLWVPFEELASGRHNGVKRHQRPGTEVIIKLPTYEVGGKVVWGLTYMMLRNLFDILERSDEEQRSKKSL